MLFILPFFTGDIVGLVDGVVDGVDDGVMVVFDVFLPPTAFVIVGGLIATGAACGAGLQAFSQPQATRKAGKSSS